MSASLVGSEMCIRDSVRGTLGPSDAPRCIASASRAPRAKDCADWRTVSYTHLTLPTICSV
eukprot:6289337-Alexandrium_andersonii.AAC.1